MTPSREFAAAADAGCQEKSGSVSIEEVGAGGLSGSFSLIVHVPAGIRQVEFGDEHDIIWTAASAP